MIKTQDTNVNTVRLIKHPGKSYTRTKREYLTNKTRNLLFVINVTLSIVSIEMQLL